MFMLVQFRFKNFGPFRGENVLDMRAVKSYKEHFYNLIEADNGELILKTASIYGANARGKSNFVEAYTVFCRMVLFSFNNKEEDGVSVLEKYYNPFLFSGDEDDVSTEFEGTYISGDCEYQYGFVFNLEKIEYEWLYCKKFSSNRKATVLERRGDEFKLGISVRKSCEPFVEQIEKDVLALSYFNRLRLKTTVFKETFYCVNSMFSLSFTKEAYTHVLLKTYFREPLEEDDKKRLLEFLAAVDVGIKGIDIERNKDKIEIYTHHTGADGKDYKIPLTIESDGTRKLIALYNSIRTALELGKGLIVDELNTQLHPLLQKYIIDMFHENKSGAQLIYTTHDTTLLDKMYCRRDQVWFVDKEETGEAHLYSLAEFKVRGDASYEKGYLQGLYGAIPILKDYKVEEIKFGDR